MNEAGSEARRAAAVGRALPLGLALSAAAMLPLAALAFWPQYLSRFAAADAYTHSHAAFGLLWLLALIAQPLLVRARRLAVHRIVGRAAVALGAAFVVTGILTAHRAMRRLDPAKLADEGYFLYLPLVMAAIFAAALALGVAWRKVPALHGRFMAGTALPLLDPLLARILGFHFPPLPAEPLYQVPAFALAAAVLVVLAKSLPPALPGRRAFGVFAAGTIAALLLYFLTPYSAGWLAFVAWFRALPLT